MHGFFLGHQMHKIIPQDPCFRASDRNYKEYPQCPKLQMADEDDHPYQGNDAEIDQKISFKIILL